IGCGSRWVVAIDKNRYEIHRPTDHDSHANQRQKDNNDPQRAPNARTRFVTWHNSLLTRQRNSSRSHLWYLDCSHIPTIPIKLYVQMVDAAWSPFALHRTAGLPDSG